MLQSPVIAQLLPEAAIRLEHGGSSLDEILLQEDLANLLSWDAVLKLLQDILPARMRVDILAATEGGELLRGCLFRLYFLRLNRLLKENKNGSWSGLVAAAIRELFEETGQIIGVEQEWSEVPSSWEEFAKTGYVPDASHMSFVFRAITPPGRPRRFDARFFPVSYTHLTLPTILLV